MSATKLAALLEAATRKLKCPHPDPGGPEHAGETSQTGCAVCGADPDEIMWGPKERDALVEQLLQIIALVEAAEGMGLEVHSPYSKTSRFAPDGLYCPAHEPSHPWPCPESRLAAALADLDRALGETT